MRTFELDETYFGAKRREAKEEEVQLEKHPFLDY